MRAKKIIPPDAAMLKPGKTKIRSAQRIPAKTEIITELNPTETTPPEEAATMVSSIIATKPNHDALTLDDNGTGINTSNRLYIPFPPIYRPLLVIADHSKRSKHSQLFQLSP